MESVNFTNWAYLRDYYVLMITYRQICTNLTICVSHRLSRQIESFFYIFKAI